MLWFLPVTDWFYHPIVFHHNSKYTNSFSHAVLNKNTTLKQLGFQLSQYILNLFLFKSKYSCFEIHKQFLTNTLFNWTNIANALINDWCYPQKPNINTMLTTRFVDDYNKQLSGSSDSYWTHRSKTNKTNLRNEKIKTDVHTMYTAIPAFT